jgi:DNA processing protein
MRANMQSTVGEETGRTGRLPFAVATQHAEPGEGDHSVAAATLASLPGASPPRLHALFEEFGTPAHALQAVRDGRAAEALTDDRRRAYLARLWAETADPRAVAETLRQRGTHMFSATQIEFPIDPRLDDAPAVLFAEGDRPEVLDRPRVAIVGTRAATPPGLADARAIGRYLAEQGVTVVSGLAIGIDAAAHEGALEVGGGVIGVVATGLDVVYPRRHGPLFSRVRRHGLVLGEYGFGVHPTKARFPERNRIIAALSDATVVVEATASGGARITANCALGYGRDVLAVPGSRRNPAAAGCNALIHDGAHPLLDPSDVVAILALASPASRYAAIQARGEGRAGWGSRAVRISAPAARLLAEMAGEPATLDDLVGRSGSSVGEVAGLIRELERANRVGRLRGRIWPL